ncbi:hypothetical protein BHE74_00038178 [Ensete ventricosum]|nr:hypothetical protein BHE74_00038178 [Ensete ventricosum]RZS14303.1 hypothetical protein BHM03_00045979 [Ensete ventricosum]
MTTRENQDVQDNIPPAADTAPSAAKQPAPAAKGLDGQSVLKRSCNLSFFSVALREAFPWFICFRHTSDYSIDLIFEGASGFCDDLLPCHDILSFFSVLLTLS